MNYQHIIDNRLLETIPLDAQLMTLHIMDLFVLSIVRELILYQSVLLSPY